ncbi:MAG TPA: sulfotransferase [Gammaproteobacteria bacterium]|nr:sulfotransferase [Gammaproteobacteria bacterium]
MPSDSTTAAAESTCQSGLELLSRGDFAAADRAFETAISMAPSMAQAHLGLGNSLRRQRRLHDAETALRRARTLDPALRDAAYSLAFLLHGAGRDAELTTVLMELADGEPADLTLQRQVTGLLMDFGCFEQAARLARKIAEVAPAPGAWQRLGVCLLQMQRLSEAEEAFSVAVRGDPLAGSAYLLMSQARRATAADRTRLTELQKILDSGSIVGDARACLHFALGNWLEDLGDYAGAWTQFSAANRLRRDARPFDRSAWEDYFQRLPETVAAANPKPNSEQIPQPLFLVGFPGASPEPLGSLLATHPAISSLGVSTQVDDLARACQQLADKPYPECLADIEATQLGGLEQGVRNDWPDKGKHAHWILDESPLNFIHLALIMRVFPESRIIHQHRQPWDDCLSAYLCPFPQPTCSHVHDFPDLLFFYRQYAALMDRWRENLPARTLLSLQANSEGNGPVAGTGSVWKFLELGAPDATGARQPISRPMFTADPQRRDIPGRWRNYREYLAPVFEAAGLEPE